MYLKRYHEVQISSSGVWRILKRLELNRLPASQHYKRHDRRWKRYEKPLSGHRVQLDVKFIQPLPGAPKGQEVLPVHRDRRLHPAAGPAHLPQTQPADGHPVLSLDPPKCRCAPAALAARKPLAAAGRRIQKVHDLGGRNGPLTGGSAGA